MNRITDSNPVNAPPPSCRACELGGTSLPSEDGRRVALGRARDYRIRGWCVVPIPRRSKSPQVRGWQRLRLSEEELTRHFLDPQQNIGVLLGEPSDGLIDVDLDHPRAVELAAEFLPSTPAIFGRAGKPRSHWLYRVQGNVRTKKYKSKKHGMIVELRSTGAQTVFPGSTHKSGEAIEWEPGAQHADPAIVSAECLKEAVDRLGNTILAEFSEDPKRRNRSTHAVNGHSNGKLPPLSDAAGQCLASMRRMNLVDHRDGSHRLFAAACRAVEHDLNEATAISTIRAYAQVEPFPRDWSDEEILQRLRDAEEKCTRGKALRRDRQRPAGWEHDNRPEIVVTTDEHLVNDAALVALASDPDVYERGSALVHVVRGGKVGRITRPEDSPRVASIPTPVLRERLTRAGRFVSTARKEDDLIETRNVHPPRWCVEAVHARGVYPGIRPLHGIIESPILRPDGTILDTPGYDSETGVLYLPTGQPPEIEADPRRDAALAAKELLLDIVCDFPFVSDAHRSTWLAATITVAGRHAFDGPAPLFLFDGNVAGSGKTLQTETISLITTGRTIPRTPNPRNNEEARKLILALALSSESLILIDNIEGTLGTPAIDAALTATSWRDRILGRSEMVTMPLVVTWLASGNNVILRPDTCRRVAHCRLECKEENPEERDAFRYSDLKAHVRDHRGELLGAVLTILRAYFVAGRPTQRLRRWGSYEGWSDLVRQCVVWLDLPDPADTREELRTTVERDGAILGALLRGLQQADPQALGMTTADIIKAMDRGTGETLRDAIHELCDTCPAKPPNTRTLGNKLRHLRGRIVGGRALEMREGSGGFASWRVVTARSNDFSQASSDAPAEWGEV
jgi:hypothetical protein